MSTLAPCSESSSAVARPMPRADPVTMATLPSRTPMRFSLVSDACGEGRETSHRFSVSTVGRGHRRWEDGRVAGSRTLAVLTALVAVGLAAAVVVFSILAGEHGDPAGESVVATVAILTPAAVGIALAWRVPGNVIAWLLLAQSVLLGLLFVVHPYAEYTLIEAPGALPGGRLAAYYNEASWPTLFAGLTLIALV